MPEPASPAFIVVVILLAAGTGLFWSWKDPQLAFPAMLAVLVASCPCALSLALPVVHAAASQRLLREGVLLTHGGALAALNRVTRVFFDKTGTLTRGAPELSAVTLNPERPGLDEQRAREIAAALESGSSHPLARAFAGAAGPGVLSRSVTGQGLSGEVDGETWRIGRHEFAGPAGQETEEGGGDTRLWLADMQSWVARFDLSDPLREGARETVSSLQDQGLGTGILSGDGAGPVAAVARELEIDDWHARMSPEQKMQTIRQAREQGETVLMVGDGVNDAPVLAAADVSMTVQGASDLAHSAADMILNAESLGLLQTTMNAAAKTRSLVRQNISWALFYNLSVMPLAVSGMLQPWMAALGMSLSSLLVVMNATRLNRMELSA